MEMSELLFNTVESLLNPLVILEESDLGEWRIVYANTIMRKLLQDKIDTLPSELDTLMKHYQNDMHVVHDFEFLSKTYDLNFHQSSSQLLLCFTPVEGSFFEQVTLSDLGGTCSAVVIVLDEKGNFVDANECFLNFTGKKKSEIMGQSFFENFIPGDTQKLNSYFEEIKTHTNYHQNFVTPITDTKGNVHRMNWQVSRMIRHEQTYIIAIGSDISRLINRQDNLMRQLTTIKVGFNYFPYAVAYLNHQGIFTSMNIRFKQLFGIKESSMHFDHITLFKKHIGFETMRKNIALLKEVKYTLTYQKEKKEHKIRVDIRLLATKQEASQLYIVVVHPLA